VLERTSAAQFVDQRVSVRDVVGTEPEVRLGRIPGVALARSRLRTVLRIRPLEFGPGELAPSR
jgi:hypothetical protein